MNPDLVHWVDAIPGVGDDIRSTRWELTWGGKAANVAMFLASWDVPTSLTGLVLGVDSMGDALRGALDAPMLDLSYVEQDPAARTGHCLILVTPDGERTIVCAGYESSRWQHLPESAWDDVSVLVVDGFGGDAASSVVAEGTRRGIAVVWLDAPRDADADVVVWSRHEHDPAEIGVSPARAVVVTSGAGIVEARLGAERLRLSPPKVTVGDATGAGDAVAAGVARGLWLGHSDLDAIRWGVAAGAAAVARGRLSELPRAGAIDALVPQVVAFDC
jgi:sugar/nucleoside kinase (ribokinase family)